MKKIFNISAISISQSMCMSMFIISTGITPWGNL